MNYKGFKKVKEDDLCATLRHPDGHEIRIAKKQLNGKLRDGLSRLPLHAAEGADVGEDSAPTESEQPQSNQPHVNISINAQPQQAPATQPAQQQASTAPSTVSQAPQGLATPQKPQAPADQTAQQPQAPQSAAPIVQAMPQPAPIEQVGPAGKQVIQNIPQEYQQAYAQEYQKAIGDHAREDVAWKQDLGNGHVTPKTYHDLYAKHDTLGKIGTLFGMLVSGAGSGLAHQPNAVMEMMNNEIKNDLEAQVKSKDNAQNYYKLALQQQLQEAQVHQINTAADVSKGELGLKQKAQPVELAEKSAQTQLLKTQAQLAAIPLMNISALHQLTQQVQKMSPSDPRRGQYEQALAQLSGQIDLKNSNVYDAIAAQSARNNVFKIFDQQQQQGEAQPEAAFQAKTQGMRMSGMGDIAKDMEAKHVPGVGQASREVPQDVVKELSARKDLQDSIEDLQSFAKKHSGSFDPETIRQGGAKAKTVQDKYRTANGQGVFKESEKNFVEGVLGSNPTQLFEKYRSGPGYQEAANSNLRTMNNIHESWGLPKVKSKSEPGQGASQQTMEMKDPKTGKIYIVDPKSQKVLRAK